MNGDQPPARRSFAEQLLREFAERTGLGAERAQQRYLWTDAYALDALLSLHRSTGDPDYAELARGLVEQVHRVLGSHRADAVQHGWLGGAGKAAEAHPTRAGLRIGKPLPERRPDERPDPRLEWDRDGQYFHYLTKWMSALAHMARHSGKPEYRVWACELALAAHRAFVYRPPGAGAPRMYWKMSIDLSRPLVSSMGQHDPLDGYVTYRELESTVPHEDAGVRASLGLAIRDFSSMLAGAELATDDPLGLGGLLADAFRLARLEWWGPARRPELLERVLAAAFTGLLHYGRQGELRQTAARRLAFRELGLVIGLHGLELMLELRPEVHRQVGALLDALAPYLALRDVVLDTWLRPEHRQADSWMQHRDINDVMLAACLVPGAGLLGVHASALAAGGSDRDGGRARAG